MSTSNEGEGFGAEKKILVQEHPKIETRNRNEQPNGFLVPIFNVNDKFVEDAQHPKQVYLTTVTPHEVKGPHLHMKRWQLYTCIKGNVKFVTRVQDRYEEYFSGEDHGFATVQVPAGIPSAIINEGDEEAYVINMPSPAWHIDDQDEHEVSFEDYFSRQSS